MKTKFIFSFLLSTFSLFAFAQQWTLEQCIETALANNRNIKQREFSREQSKIALQQARLDLLPNLSASASQSWSYGRSQMIDGTYHNINSSSASWGLSSGITLFDGLRMKYNIDARMSELRMSEANLEKIRQDIVLSVSTAFLQVLLNKELLQIATEQLSLTEQRIARQHSLVEAGRLAEGELLELVAQQSREELSKIQAENTLKLSLLDLAQILELSNFETLDVIASNNLITNELALLNADEVYRNAVANRPEIRAAEEMLVSSQTNVKLARSAYFPSLSFGANTGSGYYNKEATPLNTSIGFSLSVPIFNKFATVNNVKTANINVESNRLNLDNTKIELRKNVQQAVYNAVSAKARWEAAQKSEQSSVEAYRFVEKKYESERATVYEFYQAKNNLSKSQSEVAQSKFEYVFRLKIIELLQTIVK